MPQPAPEPPMVDPRRQSPPPPMVLVDRCVVLEIIEEAEGGRLACSSGSGEKIVPIVEPLPEFLDAYSELLDGIELCFSQLADPPSVTRLSLKLSCPPKHVLANHPSSAFLSSCHHCFLVFYVGSYRPCIRQRGFYLVYNAWANSVAIVPRIHCINNMSRINNRSHSDIGSGVAVLCCGKQDDFVLVELLLRRDSRSGLPTNTANLFVWEQSGRFSWDQREVVLPFPVAEERFLIYAADQTTVADEQQMLVCSFHADMVFAVSFSSLCWVDLLTGILVYNHIGSREFHFIPLPEELAVDSGMRNELPYPKEYRSMCCIDRQTLKFVYVDGFEQLRPADELMITTWTLRRPLSPRNWKWEKDAVPPFRIRDVWDDPVYKPKLRTLTPTCPVISTREPGIIYLSVTDYKFVPGRNCPYCNQSCDELESAELYVLSLNMDRRRVESVCKVPTDNGTHPNYNIFTSEFSSYLNKTREWDLIRCRRDDLYEGPRGKQLADEGESRSNASSPYTVGAGLGMLKSSRGGLGGRRAIITTPRTAPGPSSRKTRPWASSFRPAGLQDALDVGLQAVLDIAIV